MSRLRLRHQASSGFTLVELIIAIAIIGILLSLALPSMQVYVANSRLRAEAQSMLVGLQKARSEAIQRNVAVEFVLTNAGVLALDPATGVANGRNWVIQFADTSIPPPSRVLIEGRSSSDSGQSTDLLINDTDGDGAADAGSVAFVTFNGSGGTTLPAGTVFRFTSSLARCSNPANRSIADFPGSVQLADTPPRSDLRCLNIALSRGGSARLCDPAVVPSVGDTRSC